MSKVFVQVFHKEKYTKHHLVHEKIINVINHREIKTAESITYQSEELNENTIVDKNVEQ